MEILDWIDTIYSTVRILYYSKKIKGLIET
jgi:hypothetical protein